MSQSAENSNSHESGLPTAASGDRYVGPPRNLEEAKLGSTVSVAATSTELTDALADVIDLAIWMSGASAFGPEGEAGEAWPEQRERLYAAIAALRRAREGGACSECGGRDGSL